MLLELRCECGYVASGEGGSFIAAVRAHASTVHKTDLSPDDILALATPADQYPKQGTPC